MLTINFLEPTMLHPMSDKISVADLGIILEKKYGLISKFINKTEKQLNQKLLNLLLKSNGYTQLYRIEQWLQGEWRNFIVSQLHGIKTGLASKEGRESFINTGSYYRNLQVKIKVS